MSVAIRTKNVIAAAQLAIGAMSFTGFAVIGPRCFSDLNSCATIEAIGECVAVHSDVFVLAEIFFVARIHLAATLHPVDRVRLH